MGHPSVGWGKENEGRASRRLIPTKEFGLLAEIYGYWTFTARPVP